MNNNINDFVIFVQFNINKHAIKAPKVYMVI